MMPNIPQDWREVNAYQQPQLTQREMMQAAQKYMGYRGTVPDSQQQATPQAAFGQLFPNQKTAQQLAQQMLAQPAQNVAHGIGQMAAGAGLGLAKFNQQGSAFPSAPGGATSNFATGLANFFTGRNNGGLK
ncbi:MAG: hypothetical protein PGN22_02875 [Agrobacterium cavarae]